MYLQKRRIHKTIAGFQRDEVYIGTAEERAAKHHADDATHLHVGAGHIVKLPGFVESAPPALLKLMASDPSIAEYINKSIRGMEDGTAKEDTDPEGDSAGEEA
jgi:hypothetical protein